MQKLKIKSVKSLGFKKTYNLTMKSEQHNYALYDDNSMSSLITRNSHACCYAYNSYITAYLKANYPEEFLASYLNVEIGRSNYDKVYSLEKMAKDMNIDILQRQINLCKVYYSIATKSDPANGMPRSQIIPSLKCKGLSDAAAAEIVAKQPFSSLKEFAEKTETRIVDAKAFESLLNAGFFKPKQGRGKSREDIMKEFLMIREDLKRARKKGVDAGNIFG